MTPSVGLGLLALYLFGGCILGLLGIAIYGFIRLYFALRGGKPFDVEGPSGEVVTVHRVTRPGRD